MGSSLAVACLFTSPMGRGRSEAPGEGVGHHPVRPQTLAGRRDAFSGSISRNSAIILRCPAQPASKEGPGNAFGIAPSWTGLRWILPRGFADAKHLRMRVAPLSGLEGQAGRRRSPDRQPAPRFRRMGRTPRRGEATLSRRAPQHASAAAWTNISVLIDSRPVWSRIRTNREHWYGSDSDGRG